MENQETNTSNINLEELKNQAIEAIDFYFSSEENKKNSRFAPSMIVNAYGDLGKNENLKQKIINEHESFTDIFADVVSSIENPNCSCRARFASFISNNVEPTVNAYKAIINSIDEDSKNSLTEVVQKQKNFFEAYKNQETETNESQNIEEKKEKSISIPISKLPNVKILHDSQTPEKETEDGFSRPKILSNPFPVYLEGNVIEIENSAVAYGELIKGLRESGEYYRGMNLLQKPNNKIWVYFY